jgi:hypothetical protein
MNRTILIGSIGLLAVACQEYEINEKPDAQGRISDDDAPDIEVDPLEIDFGDVLAYETGGDAPPDSELQVVTVRNVGLNDLHISSIEVGDESDATFEVSAISSSLIPPEGSAEFTVSYSPFTAEENSGIIYVNSDDPDEATVEILLNGKGIAPIIELDPTEYDFGTLWIGCDAEQTFTISNVGTAELVVDNIDFNTASVIDLKFDANEATNGPLPWTLMPGEVRQVVVETRPFDEQDDTAYLMVDSNDPFQTTALATINADGELFGENTDVYNQPIKGETDIIFAVDRSCSMYDDIENVQNNFGTFTNIMSGLDADFHVAATVEDDGCINGADIYIDNTFSADDAIATITTMINLGASYGSNTERPFMLLEEALAESFSGGCNEGLIRDDATLNLIGVSDEPEQSTNNYTHYVSLFQGLKSDPDDVVMHAIGGDYPGGCGSAAAFTGFYEATVATGGLFLSICATDWGGHLETLAEGSASDLSSFELTEYPVPETITIKIDGITTTIGWEYNPSTNAIDFDSDYVPEGGATIEINYALIGDCDG